MSNSEVNSVRKHNYNCMLDDGIYWQVNNYMFRPIAASSGYYNFAHIYDNLWAKL